VVPIYPRPPCRVRREFDGEWRLSHELMDALGANSFAPTQRNALRGEGNFHPRKAYRQQAAVELSGEGLSWL
jgi:hypothetical protein